MEPDPLDPQEIARLQALNNGKPVGKLKEGKKGKKGKPKGGKNQGDEE